VPTVDKVLCLRVDGKPLQELVVATEIELGIAEIEIAVGQQQTVAAVDVISGQKVGVVGPAGERAGEQGRDFFRCVGRADEASVRRPTEGRAPWRGESSPTGIPLYVGTGPRRATSSLAKERCTTASR